jgi:hypothetical protein
VPPGTGEISAKEQEMHPHIIAAIIAPTPAHQSSMPVFAGALAFAILILIMLSMPRRRPASS